MKKILFAVLLALLFFLPTVRADTIEESNVTVRLLADDTAQIALDAQFSKITTSTISFIFYGDVLSVKGSDSLGPIACRAEQKSFGTEISCKPTISNIVGENISIYQVHLDVIKKDLVTLARDDQAIFSFTYPVTSPTKLLNVIAYLPEGTILLDTGDVKPYFPADAVISSTGRQVVLEWTVDKPALGESAVFRAQFESAGNRNQRILLWIAIVLTVLLVLTIIVFIVWRLKRKAKESPLIKTVFSVLRADERKVLDVLVAHGGSCKQREIVKQTDFSKAKVSRILADLEKRGIVEKDRTGRTNKIVLKDPTQQIEKKEEVSAEQKDEEKKPTFGE